MNDWIAYIKNRLTTDLWGAIFLDYFLAKKAADSEFNESQFIDTEIPKIYSREIDIVRFHRVFIQVCVQILGTGHHSIVLKSINFLISNKSILNKDKLSHIKEQYVEFGWENEFQTELEKAGLVDTPVVPKLTKNIQKRQNNIQTTSAPKESFKILCVATEWFSQHGGVSTFNRQLCISLAEERNNKVFCFVPSFTDDEENDAKNFNVFLVKAAEIPGDDPLSRLNTKPLLNNEIPDLLIGHDRFTGPYILALKENHFLKAKTALFIHIDPEEIEPFKPSAGHKSKEKKGEERRQLQLQLSKKANLVAAVGPKLFMEFDDRHLSEQTKAKVIQFNPGIFEYAVQVKPIAELNMLNCLLLCRVEDDVLKGLDIAAQALCKVRQNWKLNTKPGLIIRGIKEGTGDEIREKVKEYCNSGLEPRIKEYSSATEDIIQDIKASSLVLMPSRSEGFGLSALEAISLNRPALISKNSGLAQLIESVCPQEQAAEYILPTDGDNVIDNWAKSIEFILFDRKAAIKRLNIFTKNFSKKISWSKSIKEFILAAKVAE